MKREIKVLTSRRPNSTCAGFCLSFQARWPLLPTNSTPLSVNAFHEKAGKCQVFFLFFLLLHFFFSSFSRLFPLSQAASVATLPSALFVERLSLGASWVYLIQSFRASGPRKLMKITRW